MEVTIEEAISGGWRPKDWVSISGGYTLKETEKSFEFETCDGLKFEIDTDEIFSFLEKECDWCKENEPELCPEHLAEKNNI